MAHCVREAGVGGSNPLTPTKKNNNLTETPKITFSAHGQKNPTKKIIRRVVIA